MSKDKIQIFCEWKADNEGVWYTSCEHLHQFIDGGPKDNHHIYCPYCGMNIKQLESGEEE